VVGDLSLSFNRLEVSGDHAFTLVSYVAQPGSRDEQAMKLLASWAATLNVGSSQPASGA
jgi:hypothetical protein